MKKILSAAVAVMIITFLTIPVFAHGHSSYKTVRSVPAANHSICSIKNCTLTGLHTHGDVTYAAHHINDGHTYHQTNGRHH